MSITLVSQGIYNQCPSDTCKRKQDSFKCFYRFVSLLQGLYHKSTGLDGDRNDKSPFDNRHTIECMNHTLTALTAITDLTFKVILNKLVTLLCIENLSA